MGLESAPQSALGRIDPSSLIGRPEQVVTPNAVELLSNAVRNGAITAADITARIQQEPAMREKANLETMLSKEGQTPEAQALRQKGQAVASQQLDLQQAQIKYGPAIQYFQALAPKAGITPIVDSNGNPDYEKMAEVGSKLFAWQTAKDTAMERLQPVTWKEATGPDGKPVQLKFNKRGELITPELERTLVASITSPFSDVAPGTATPAPIAATPAPIAATPPAFAPHPYAGKVGVPQEEAVSRNQQLSKFLPSSPMVQPKTGVEAPPVVSPATPNRPVIEYNAGEEVPGLGMSLGAKPVPAVTMTGEQQKTLSQAALTSEQFKELENSFKTVSKEEPWLTGPVLGRLSSWTFPENWNANVASFERAKTAILANLAKGIYHETGVLSDKDIERYSKALPTRKDTAEAAQAKLRGVQKDIFTSIISNIETMKGQGQTITPIIDGMEQSARQGLQQLTTPTAAPSAAAPSAPIITVSSGRKIQRDVNGIPRIVP